jgi:hypothetical protein
MSLAAQAGHGRRCIRRITTKLKGESLVAKRHMGRQVRRQTDTKMPAYNFQSRFAPLVESGQKRQTIRQTAKGAMRGATAFLYTGQRTAHCRKLGEGTITDVLPIEIGRHACSEPYANITERDGKQTHLAHEHLDALARDDGFVNGEEMADWFDAWYGLPFTGFLHMWQPTKS